MSVDPSLESVLETSRRDLLKLGAAAGLGAVLSSTALSGCTSLEPRLAPAPQTPLVTPPMSCVRVGIVGVGGMGMNHLEQLLKVPGAEVTAVCDIVPEKVARAQDVVAKAGRPRPAGYDRGPHDYERLCAEAELDLVYVVTPWEWHVPMCVAAMKHGKHAAVEMPAAYTLDGCWELVETAEKTRRHCVQLENCCYDRPELMVLNMIRKGLFGDVLHAECGYLHDLRGIKFATEGEGLWRRAHSTMRNGNLYPTHGLGPVANYMNINRGDRFDYLVSMSGPSRGLQLWQKEHIKPDDPRSGETFVLGDVNVTLIKTVGGRTIYLVHDTNLPRPYDRINMVQGERGLFMGYPNRIHIEGRSPAHQWEPLEKYAAEFEHPLWRSEKVKTAGAMHGGMDFLESYRLVQCLVRGEPTDMNVYDAAALSAICELTERSVAGRSRAVDVPDFTRGRWRTTPPWPIVAA